MFNPLHSITNQELFEKHLCNQSSHYEKYYYEWKPSHTTAKLTPFAVSKDEWDTKEDTGKSMKNALYVVTTYCGMPKGTCPAEATSHSEKIKPVALAMLV